MLKYVVWYKLPYFDGLVQERHNSIADALKVRLHDDVIKWKHFLRYWPFVWGIDQSPVNSPNKGQWCGALMFSLICAWIRGWVSNREAGDLGRHHTHYDANVMSTLTHRFIPTSWWDQAAYHHATRRSAYRHARHLIWQETLCTTAMTSSPHFSDSQK